MLRSHFSTVAVDCAREAHSLLLESSIYSAIVCDLSMTVMDGVALFELVKEARPEVADRFVFVTGGAFNSRLQNFVSSVSNFVLVKPIHANELVHVISRLAQGRTKRCPWH
jgi:two-component system, NtrC family, sensor kinase